MHRSASLVIAAALTFVVRSAFADQSDPRSAEEASPPFILMGALEVRPPPRAVLVLEHPVGQSLRLAHALTLGFGTFPDVEIRTGLLPALLDPAYPWLALRIKRISLEGLPPVENYLSFGVGFASDARRRISFDAGAGLRFQLPPLAAEPAGDIGAYFAENIHAEVRFGLRVRIW